MKRRDPSVQNDDPAPIDGEISHGEPTNRPSAWNQSAAFRFVGLGTELAGFTLVLAGLGYLLDSLGHHSKPYGTAIGALIGFTMGMVRFVQQVQKRDDN